MNPFVSLCAWNQRAFGFRVRIRNTTTGDPVTGLVAGDVTAKYSFDGAAYVNFTPSAFVEDAEQPGDYLVNAPSATATPSGFRSGVGTVTHTGSQVGGSQLEWDGAVFRGTTVVSGADITVADYLPKVGHYAVIESGDAARNGLSEVVDSVNGFVATLASSLGAQNTDTIAFYPSPSQMAAGAKAAATLIDQAISSIPTTAEIEGALLNEGDGQALLDAIIVKINADLDVNAVELTAIATAVVDRLNAQVVDGAITHLQAMRALVALSIGSTQSDGSQLLRQDDSTIAINTTIGGTNNRDRTAVAVNLS